MIIRAEQINFTIADLKGNVNRMAEALQLAKSQGVDLVVFSELSLCGYIPKDMLEYEHFITACEEAIEGLLPHTKEVAALIGAPMRSHLAAGKSLYNSALFLYEAEVKQSFHKALLPTYDIFDEYRYFEPATEFDILHFKGKKIAISICEDLWNLDDPILYKSNPMDRLIQLEPDFIINLSGSPYSYNHVEERISRMQQNARHYQLPLIYVNQVGAHTDILFDGGSMFINSDGKVLERLKHFEEDRADFDLNALTVSREIMAHRDHDIADIHDALIMGVKDYFRRTGFRQAVLGSSGGIDSAVVHALAAEALGSENVQAILLPGPFSSEGSVNDARELAKRLGSPYEIIPISDTVLQIEGSLSKHFSRLERDVTEENIQARIRGVMLMAWSNKFGHLLLNTSNKSEAAVGYTTLYGDMCGGLSPIGDLYKTQVYEMARYINRHQEIIPNAILTKAPSAELRPDQKDSDSLPEYDILDRILYLYIECEWGAHQIIEQGFNKELVARIIRLIDRNEYKRFQASPILRISHKAFGIGRQMPLVARYPF